MAPTKPLKTYSKGNKSIISCVGAFNLLFAKNLTERKLRGKITKGKSKVQIKELPKKISTHVKSVFSDDSSLHVHVNDTFDRVCKDPDIKNISTKGTSIRIISNNTSTSVIKHLSGNNSFSPIVSKLRSYKSRSQNSNLTTSNSWFKQPTLPGERVTNELEIERINLNKKKLKEKNVSVNRDDSRTSPIRLRPRDKIPEIQITSASKKLQNSSDSSLPKEYDKINGDLTSTQDTNVSFNPIFTNSVREKMVLHCSTPLISHNRSRLVKHPISPIKTVDDEIKSCIFESLEEIKSWEESYPKSECKEKSRSLTKVEEYKQIPDEISDQSQLKTHNVDFVTVRGKPINREANGCKENRDNIEKYKCFSLEDFEKFQNKINLNNLESTGKLTQTQVNWLNTISLEGFESFYQAYRNKISFFQESSLNKTKKLGNYVTQRKNRNSMTLNLKYQKLSHKFDLKQLVVVLDNILIRNSTFRPRKSDNVHRTAMMNSFARNQSMTNLRSLSIHSLTPFKIKDRMSLNSFRACRKFSSNCNETKVINLGQLYSTNKSSLKITEVNDADCMIRKSSSPNTRISFGKSQQYVGDIFGEENLTTQKTLNITKNSLRGFENSCSSPGSTSTPFKFDQFRKSRQRLESEQEDDNPDILAFLHPKTPFKTPSSVKEYTAKILVCCASDSELEMDRNSSLTDKSENVRSASQENLKSCTNSSSKRSLSLVRRRSLRNRHSETNIEQNIIDVSAKNGKRMSNPSQESETNIEQNFIDASAKIGKRMSNPSQEDLAREVNSRLYSSATSTPYFAQDMSRSIFVDDNKERNFSTNAMIKDVVVNLTLHCFDKETTPNKQVFKAPKSAQAWKQKMINLKAGKMWRRSLLLHKRESFIDLTQDRDDGSISHQHSSLHQNTSAKRRSSRIVPLCDPRLSRRTTVLQTYAQSNLSTILDNSETDPALLPTRSKIQPKESLPLVSAKEIVLKRCGQTEPLPFEKLYPESLLKKTKKIGEGVYGEVFLYSDESGESTVMKVIPIEGAKIVNGERQKKFDEILTEIIIASELSKLRQNVRNQTSAFSEVRRICCVKGQYPKTLLDLWEAYDVVKGSENDSPVIFDDDQLYIILDLANAGRDLEAFVFTNAIQAVSMFKQVACALAVAEQQLQFEHRDLHWGNVLLKAVDKNKKVFCKHKGKRIENETQGVEATIIDFTLSRISHDGVVIFNDLGQDPDLFVAEGDYQFDIYRLMRKHNSDDWQKFDPYSNILWLHYILKKSLTALRYKNTKTKIHKKHINCLKEYERVILNFNSVSEFLCEHF